MGYDCLHCLVQRIRNPLTAPAMSLIPARSENRSGASGLSAYRAILEGNSVD
jgi:hypothetical protein